MPNAAAVYLSKWSSRSDTHKTMRKALARLVGVLSNDVVEPEEFGWHELRYEDVRAVAADLADEDYGPNTINLSLSALRGVLEVAWRAGMMPDDVYRRIEIKSVAGNSERAGRALSPAEMDVIAVALDKTEPRDAAMIAVLAGAGLRRVELVRLRGEDFERSTGRITARGKGNKWRTIPVGDRWLPHIQRWCASLEGRLPMFALGKDGRRQVSYIVERFCAANNLLSFTPHDLRRTFGTHVEMTGGMALAQHLLGHASMQTTSLYVRVNEERERNAVKDL